MHDIADCVVNIRPFFCLSTQNRQTARFYWIVHSMAVFSKLVRKASTDSNYETLTLNMKNTTFFKNTTGMSGRIKVEPTCKTTRIILMITLFVEHFSNKVQNAVQ